MLLKKSLTHVWGTPDPVGIPKLSLKLIEFLFFELCESETFGKIVLEIGVHSHVCDYGGSGRKVQKKKN